MRFILLILVGAGVLFWYGCREFRVSQGTSAQPVAMELSVLEAGTPPENNHLGVGTHIAVYEECIYEYEMAKYEKGQPKASTKVNHAYYPIISESHPFMTALNELSEKYNGLENVPDDVPFPPFQDFAVLVKTERFKNVGAIPQRMAKLPGVEGLVINRIESLDDKEARLLRGSFPKIDISNILILEEGRKPSSLALSVGAMGGSVLIILFALGSIFKSRRPGVA